LAPIL
jgi:hypothetical protein